MYFLILSSLVHAVALRQYIGMEKSNVVSETDVSAQNEPPAKLLASSAAHLEVLKTITSHSRRFNHPILKEAYRLLRTCHFSVIPEPTKCSPVNAELFMLYRWTGKGTGILSLDRPTAEQIWEFPRAPEAVFFSDGEGWEQSLRGIIVRLSSSQSRLCEDGYFDLSITL
jgi:hypothetical protein